MNLPQDKEVEILGEQLAKAVVSVLGDQVTSIIGHGSAIKGGYIPGFSDFDFVICHTGKITFDQKLNLHNVITSIDPAPFSYFQISSFVCVDTNNLEPYLLAKCHKVLYGTISLNSLLFFTEEQCLEKSKRYLADYLSQDLAKDLTVWATAVGVNKTQRVRLGMARLLSSIRSWLTVQTNEPFAVWSAPLLELITKTRTFNSDWADDFEAIIKLLPPTKEEETKVGNMIFSLVNKILEPYKKAN